MSPAVALFLMALSCQDPAMNFREFFAKFYSAGGSIHWSGIVGETQQTVVIRQIDAAADFLDYRVARMEKCK